MPEAHYPNLKFVPREGGYARGQEGFELILKAALSVLVDQGYRALTLRGIAKDCGLKAGNISYYFKSKDDLVRALLESVAGSYEASIEEAVKRGGDDPERKLTNLIAFILDDITTRQTTHIFPELWALSNHDPFVKERLEELYGREHVHFDRLVRDVNPDLPADERGVVTAFIIAALEGTTVFAGYGKSWRASMPQMQTIAAQCFVAYVKAMKPGDSKALATGAVAAQVPSPG